MTAELTGSNWKKKAIVRDGLYIWVVREYRSSGDRKIYRYYVCIHSAGKHKKLEKSFSKRDRALAYANAPSRDEGEYPAKRCPVTCMIMPPGLGCGPVTTEVAMGKAVTR